MKIRSLFILAALPAVAAPLKAQTYTQDGAVKGGVLGAIAGGIIGHQNDETPEGIILGGAVGALTGGLIGQHKDEQIARDRYYASQYAYQQQRLARAVSMADAVQMTRSGISDSVIVNQIRTNGVQNELHTRDIISLTQQGVSENVILAMQRAPVGCPSVVHVPVTRQPSVVVRREYHVAPRYVPHLHVYHGHPGWVARRPHRR